MVHGAAGEVAKLRLYVLLGWGKLAAMAAVRKVNSKSDGQPSKEPQPGKNGETRHQQEAKQHTQDGCREAARCAESPPSIGIAVAQDDDAYGHENESEQSADI